MEHANENAEQIRLLRGEVARQRRLIVALAVATGVGWLSAFAASGQGDVVTAKRFVVLDDSGNTRAVLGLHAVEDEVRVRTSGPGRMDLEFPVVRQVAALRLVGEEGAEAVLSADMEDRPSLLLSEEDDDEMSYTFIDSETITIEYSDDETDWSGSLCAVGWNFSYEWDEEDSDDEFELTAALDFEDGLTLTKSARADGRWSEGSVRLELGEDRSPALRVLGPEERILFQSPASDD